MMADIDKGRIRNILRKTYKFAERFDDQEDLNKK